MNFLNQIKQDIYERVKQIHTPCGKPPTPPNFIDIFQHKRVIIAELKFASPSHGRIYHGNYGATSICLAYLEQGASALSVLTEPKYFDGNINTIRQVRRACPNAHILQKDFILCEEQILEAAHAGANAILLIVSFLEKAQLKSLFQYAQSLGLTAIVEIHDERELENALEINAKVIAINNRNLKTLDIDLAKTSHLVKRVPHGVHTICASGITSKDQLSQYESLGCHGFLIGSVLMKENSPAEALIPFMRRA